MSPPQVKVPGRAVLPTEAPTMPAGPQPDPLPHPGWAGLPGYTGVIMETGEAGPPGRKGMSGRGLPRGVDGQTRLGRVPSAEGVAGAPGKAQLSARAAEAQGPASSLQAMRSER